MSIDAQRFLWWLFMLLLTFLLCLVVVSDNFDGIP